MPFGLSNAAATSQSLMNQVFRNQLRRFVLVFFNDILVYVKDSEAHEQHLKEVLTILASNKLYANKKEMSLWAEADRIFGTSSIG